MTETGPRLDSAASRAVILAVTAVLAAGAIFALVLLLTPKQRITATDNVNVAGWTIPEISPKTGPLCTQNRFLPAGTGAVQVQFGTYGKPGQPVEITVKEDGKVVSTGRTVDYKDGEQHLAQITPIDHTIPRAEVCFKTNTKLAMAGNPSGAPEGVTMTLKGKEQPGSVHVGFFSAEKQSLLSHLPTVFARASLFRPGWFGSWVYYLLALLIPAVIVGYAVAMTRMLNAGGASWNSRKWLVATALLVAVNGFAWSVVTPTFMTPDEPSHYAYVESVAERGKLPDRDSKSLRPGFSMREQLAFYYANSRVLGAPEGRLPWSPAAYARWQKENNALPPGRDQGGGWTAAVAYSPLYYGPAAVPYLVTSHGDIWTSVWAVRMWSLLLTIGAALFCFLLARELLPTVPWAAPIAGLIAGFQPMFLHIGASINNDSMLVFFASAFFYFAARSFRRGFSVKLAAAAGAMLGLGIVAKPTMLAFIPAALFALGYAAFKAKSGEKPTLKHGLALAGAAGAAMVIPIAIYYMTFAAGDSTVSSAEIGTGSTTGMLSYIWQWYLPKLPFMATNPAVSAHPVFGVFIAGFFARFGWLDIPMNNAWYKLITIVLGLLLAGALAWAWRERARFSKWWAPLAFCVIAVVGNLLVINIRSYQEYVASGLPFAQGRYLLPLLGILGAGVVAGAQGFKRWGPAVAAACVCGLMLLNLFGMTLVLSRFYV